MSNPNDAAFPQGVPDDKYHWQHTGLTKREYFAAMAMQGLLANPLGYANSDIASAGSLEAAVASDAVTLADALLHKLEEAK